MRPVVSNDRKDGTLLFQVAYIKSSVALVPARFCLGTQPFLFLDHVLRICNWRAM